MHLNNMCKIIDLQYIGNVYWFNKLIKSENIVFSSSERYRKMSFRNRAIVAGSNGTINLSVPIESGRNQKLAFSEIKISYNQPWQAMHWNTITSCYGRAPFFEYYQHGLRNFFENRTEFLFQYNLNILDWLIKTMKLPINYHLLKDKEDISGFEDCRDICLPKNYRDFQPCPEYPQVFGDRIGFINNLSVLDLLFNAGPEAGNILSQFR